MSSAVVGSIGHLAIRTRDLDAAVQHAVETMGMRETQRDGGTSYLRVGDEHHSLQYVAADEDGLDHLGLLAAVEAGATALVLLPLLSFPLPLPRSL